MKSGKVIVTQCAAAYLELETDERVKVEVAEVASVLPVELDLGIGRSVIYFVDGGTMNVMESVEELYELGIGS